MPCDGILLRINQTCKIFLLRNVYRSPVGRRKKIYDIFSSQKF